MKSTKLLCKLIFNQNLPKILEKYWKYWKVCREQSNYKHDVGKDIENQ